MMSDQKKYRKMNIFKGICAVFSNGSLFIYTISCIFPLIWIMYSSLKTQAEFAKSIISLPKTPQIHNYISAFQKTRMPVYMLNSFRNTMISLTLIVFISFITGYFISRFDFKGKKVIYTYYLFGLIVPVHALLVPTYLLFKNFGISNQWYTLILPYAAYGLPFAILLVESYMGGIPKEMEEAAAIDGSSFTRTLFTIIFPMAVPVVTTVTIMQFFVCWNEFPFALILINNDLLRTIPIGLTYFQQQHNTDFPRLMAAMVIALMPVAIVYFSFSSRIMKGVAAGAVKG